MLEGRLDDVQAAAQRFACSLITLDHQQHDRISVVLKTYYPEELLPTL